jgi:hypothetical protein
LSFWIFFLAVYILPHLPFAGHLPREDSELEREDQRPALPAAAAAGREMNGEIPEDEEEERRLEAPALRVCRRRGRFRGWESYTKP